MLFNFDTDINLAKYNQISISISQMLNQTFMIFIDKYFITMSIPSLHNRGSKHLFLLYNNVQNFLAVDFQLSQMHM